MYKPSFPLDEIIDEDIKGRNLTYYYKKNAELDIDEVNEVITLLIVGGSGKTSLINGMTNYLCGVEYDDRVRLKLIKEDPNRCKTQSQTQDINLHCLRPNKNIFNKSIRFFDTPGYSKRRNKQRKNRKIYKRRMSTNSWHLLCNEIY